MNRKNWNSVLLIIAVLLINFALIIILLTPLAKNYEISIYDAYPIYFWLFLIISIFLAQIVILRSAATKNDKYWKYGLVIILLIDTLLLFLPLIRGYYFFGRNDELYHLGLIKTLINTAHLSPTDFYPNMHLLATNVYYLGNISLNSIVSFLPPIFPLFFIISTFLLAREILQTKKQILFVMVLASILMISHESTTFAPSAQDFFLIPFVLYLFFKGLKSKNTSAFKILLIIFIFSMVFIHPLNILFLILVFLILELSIFIYNKKYKDKNTKIYIFEANKSQNIILIAFITFFVWYFSFSIISNDFQTVAYSLFSNTGTEFIKYASLTSTYHLKIIDYVKIIINEYGQIVFLGILSFFLTIFIFFKSKHINKGSKFNYQFFFISTLVFAFLSGLFFLFPLIVGFQRIVPYFIFFSIFFVGLGLSLIFHDNNFSFKATIKKKLSFLCLSLVLISLLWVSIFNLYWSPISELENQQVTHSEVLGFTWLFDTREQTMPIDELGISQGRMYDGFGLNFSNQGIRYGNAQPPDHFNYSYNETYLSNRYLVITTLGKEEYPEIYPNYEDYWRFNNNDFENLDNNNHFNEVYQSNDLDIYLIN